MLHLPWPNQLIDGVCTATVRVLPSHGRGVLSWIVRLVTLHGHVTAGWTHPILVHVLVIRLHLVVLLHLNVLDVNGILLLVMLSQAHHSLILLLFGFFLLPVEIFLPALLPARLQLVKLVFAEFCTVAGPQRLCRIVYHFLAKLPCEFIN